MKRQGLRLARVAVIAATIASGLIADAPAANATGSCGNAPKLTSVSFFTGNVTASEPDDWWYHQSILPSHTYTLRPYRGDADLEVWKVEFGSGQCSFVQGSYNGGTTPDQINVVGVGDYYLHVMYYSGTTVDYRLEATNP